MSEEIQQRKEKISLAEFSKIVNLMEEARQKSVLEQLRVTDKENERQHQQGMEEIRVEERKWNKAYWAVVITSIVFGIAGLIFISLDKVCIGSCIIAGLVTGILGYLAGVGSSKTKQ